MAVQENKLGRKKKYISGKNLKKKNILEFLQKKGIFGTPRENKEFFVQGGGELSTISGIYFQFPEKM